MKLIAGKKFLLLYPSMFETDWTKSIVLKPQMVYIHQFLKKYFDVYVLDLDNEFDDINKFKEDAVEKILSYDFDYLGISCWTSQNYLTSKFFAEKIKKRKPNIKIIVGGYHPTYVPKDFEYENTPFDKVIKGEINNILKYINTDVINTDVIDTDVIDTNIIYNKPDFLSYPYYLQNKGGILGIFLSAGCPYNCVFCADYKKHAIIEVNEAVEYVYWIENNLYVKELKIFDPLFGINNKWRKEFIQGLINKKIKIPIEIFSRIDILDEEDIKLFSKLNISIKFGIESFSKEMLLIMNKTKNPDKYLDSFIKISKLCIKYKVNFRIYLLYNHPGESAKTISEHNNFFNNIVKKEINKYIQISYFNFTLFPGSFVYNNIDYYEKKYGSDFIDKEWWKKENGYDTRFSIIPSKNFSNNNQEIKNKIELFNFKSKKNTNIKNFLI